MYKIIGDSGFMRVISGMARGTKLYTLEGSNTRPTLDRVKEALFNIIQYDLEGSYILDLFAGSGSLGIESLSRKAKFCTFCDNSYEAVSIIKKNIEKTRFNDLSKVYNMAYDKALLKMKDDDLKFDIVFLDPPYETDYIQKSLELIIKYELLNDDAILILETDNQDRILKEIEKIQLDVRDVRKYGRVSLIFLKRKG